MKKNILLTIALLLAGFAHAGKVYKWTDANGIVHYSDKRPEKVESETVKIKSGVSEKAPAATDTLTPKASNEKAEDEDAAEKKQSMAAAEAERIKKTCDAAKKNYDQLNSGLRVRIQEEDGLRVISEEERVERSNEVSEYLDKYCNG